MENYKLKYLKYKAKYLYLKEQLGGEMYYDSTLPIKEINNEDDFNKLKLGKERFKIKDFDLLKKLFGKVFGASNSAQEKINNIQKQSRDEQKRISRTGDRGGIFNVHESQRNAEIEKLKKLILNIKVFVVGSEGTFGDVVKFEKVGDKVKLKYSWNVMGNYELIEPISEMDKKWFFVIY